MPNVNDHGEDGQVVAAQGRVNRLSRVLVACQVFLKSNALYNDSVRAMRVCKSFEVAQGFKKGARIYTASSMVVI